MFIGNQQTPTCCFTTNKRYKKSLLTTICYIVRSTCRSDGSLSNLNVIILRWNKARGEIVDDLRATTEDSSESSFWIDDHIKRVFKKLVHSFIDAENQLYGLQIRKKKLESCKSDGKVLSGLKINVVAKVKAHRVFMKS